MNEEQVNSFPESIREWDEVKNSDTPEVFWDRMTNLRSKLGTGLYKPGEDAGTEDWGKFSEKAIELSGNRLMPRPDLEDAEQRKALFKSMGKPDSAEDYEFAEIEGSELNEDRKKFVSEVALEIGLTKAQLKTLDEKIRTVETATLVEAQDNFKTDLNTLKQEWGLLYEERVHAAKKIAQSFFPQLVEGTQFSAAEIRSFHSIAKQMGEGGSEFRQQGQNQNQMMTPNDAAEKIGEMRNNKEHPYNDPRSPGHIAAKKRMRELYLIKNGLPAE